MKVKIILAGADGKVFVHPQCTQQDGEDYELHPELTNSNQAEMFCYACRQPLGYDHSIRQRIHYKFLREEEDRVLVELNGFAYSLYSPQFSIELAEKIETIIGRRLTTEEDSWVWDLNTEEQTRDF